MLIDVGVFLIYFIASIDPRKLLHWGLVTLWHKYLSNNLNGLVKHKYNFFLKKKMILLIRRFYHFFKVMLINSDIWFN